MPATVGRSFPLITKHFGEVNLDRDRDVLVDLKDEIDRLLGNELKNIAENAFPNGEGATGEADTSKQRRYDFPQPAIWKPWDPNGNTVSKRTLFRKVSELMGCLRVICRSQPNRASAILHLLLSREENTAIRKQVTATIDDDPNFDTAIVDGIKGFISQHRAEKGGVASLSANEAVKSAIMACVMPFSLDQRADLSKSRVADRLGIRRERIDQAIDSLKKPKKSTFGSGRERRHDYIRDVAAPYVVSFCRDDEYSRLDTNQGILEVAVALSSRTSWSSRSGA